MALTMGVARVVALVRNKKAAIQERPANFREIILLQEFKKPMRSHVYDNEVNDQADRARDHY
jgi:hypothetical protein